MRIQKDFLIDTDSLNFVRFESMDENPTAVLKFKDGSLETVTGEAATLLRARLNDSSDDRGEGRPEQEPHSGDPLHQSRSAVIDSLRPRGFSLPVAPQYPRRNKAWFYRKDKEGEHIIAFVNAKGSCSLRTFNVTNGGFGGKHYRSGDYQDNFAELIEGAIELTIRNQPNLERDCSNCLPSHVLEELMAQIR